MKLSIVLACTTCLLLSACSQQSIVDQTKVPGVYDNLPEREGLVVEEMTKSNLEDIEVPDIESLSGEEETLSEDKYSIANKEEELRPYVDLSEIEITFSELEHMRAVAVELYERELQKTDPTIVVEKINFPPTEIVENEVMYTIDKGKITLLISVEVTANETSVDKVVKATVGYVNGDVAQLMSSTELS